MEFSTAGYHNKMSYVPSKQKRLKRSLSLALVTFYGIGTILGATAGALLMWFLALMYR